MLDWEDISKAPIWDKTLGFGGNGTGDPSVGDGRCVVDGPFANLHGLFYGSDDNRPHCLSRAFRTGKDLANTTSSKINPDAVEKIMKMNNYEDFNLKLEEGPHNAIPRGIRGDFIRFSAPYGMFLSI